LDRWRELPKWRKIIGIVGLVILVVPVILASLVSMITHIPLLQALNEIGFFIFLWLGYALTAGLIMLGWYIWRLIPRKVEEDEEMEPSPSLTPLQPGFNPLKFGYATLLLLLYGIGLIALIAANFFGSFIYVEILILATTDIVLWLDARKINDLRGAQVINATNWLLYSVLLWIVVVPWYVFRRRTKSLH
jgi:hypothetical protein